MLTLTFGIFFLFDHCVFKRAQQEIVCEYMCSSLMEAKKQVDTVLWERIATREGSDAEQTSFTVIFT